MKSSRFWMMCTFVLGLLFLAECGQKKLKSSHIGVYTGQKMDSTGNHCWPVVIFSEDTATIWWNGRGVLIIDTVSNLNCESDYYTHDTSSGYFNPSKRHTEWDTFPGPIDTIIYETITERSMGKKNHLYPTVYSIGLFLPPFNLTTPKVQQWKANQYTPPSLSL